MSSHDDQSLSSQATLCDYRSDLLCEIKELFHRIGMFGRTVIVEHDGNRYRVSCNERGFLVYRINDSSAGRHHVPGWPVCHVDENGIFEEHTYPELANNQCTSQADVRRWLEIIENQGTSVTPRDRFC